MTADRPSRTGIDEAGARPFLAHLPVTLDLAAVTRPEWAAYAAWVVSTVVFRRFVEKVDETDFVPLATEFIEKNIPAKVRRALLDDLLGHGVLECDNVYYFGPSAGGRRGKCLCYRVGAAYRGVRIGARPITHQWLLRKLSLALAEERAALTDPTHLALRTWHDRVEVTADAPYGENVLLDRLIEGERRFTACEQGRCHTNVANLPAQYRQFIKLAGRELVSVDISTSQPLILAVLLTGRGNNKWKETEEAHHVLFRLQSDSSLNVFLGDCLNGTVYDVIAARTGLSRDDVKPMFLAVIYGHPRDMHTRVGEAIRAAYPAVFEAVAEMNYRLGHGGLPRLMQKMESQVMIGRVAARLVRACPEMPLLTVHDSILVPAEHVDYVRQVIEEEWFAEFEVVPRMKTSTFTAPQEPRRSGRSGAAGRRGGVIPHPADA